MVEFGRCEESSSATGQTAGSVLLVVAIKAVGVVVVAYVKGARMAVAGWMLHKADSHIPKNCFALWHSNLSAPPRVRTSIPYQPFVWTLTEFRSEL